jgi:TM2 domain-containing membrane protein YozV
MYPANKRGLVEGMTKNPGTAAVLSLVIPGVGQIYNGKFLRGIFWFIITPGLWIGTGGTFGWVCHVISAYTAYSYAKGQLEGSQQRT